MSDPTMRLVEAIRSGKGWGKIIDGVPIFRVHRWFSRTLPGGRQEFKTVLPGEPTPDPKDGWTFQYEVSEKDLEKIADEINRNFDDHGKPMKLLLGHTQAGAPQENQPPLFGFAADARVGVFGPKKTPAVLSKHFIKRGFEDVPAEYPERSPEYRESTKTITGVAYLKTDPRLPMGMIDYGEFYEATEDTYFYGAGFMADEKKPDDKPPEKPEGKPPEASHSPPAAPTAPTAPTPPSGAAPAPAIPQHTPLEPHEDHFMQRALKHYGCSPEALGHLGKEHGKYMASQSAMATASPTDGRNPATPVGAEAGSPTTGKPLPKKLEDEEMMMDAEEKRLYEENQTFLMQENASLYADKEYAKMVGLGVKKSTLGKFKTHLIKIRMDAKDNTTRIAACNEYLDEVKNNYARESRPPTSRDFLPIQQEHQAEGPDGPKDTIDYSDPETGAEEVAKITRYAEQNKIDLTADDGWDKAEEAYLASKKKKEQRQTA